MATPLYIPQVDPRAGYLALKAEIDAALARVLANGRFILGPEVAAFESEFAAWVAKDAAGDPAYAIGVANGTDALTLALRACGIGRGDVVVTVSHTSGATVAAIELCGATPLLVDIDPATFTLDPAQLEQVLQRPPPLVDGRAIRAVVPVHLYGHPADMDAICAIAGRRGLTVIEDCAQAPGARLGQRPVGTFGAAAAFSFYPTKNLGALGDGGAVFTTQGQIAARVRALREYGWRERYVSTEPGLNSRLDELQAAVLRLKLRHLAANNRRRGTIAAAYDRGLDGLGLQLPRAAPEVEHVYHQYVIRHPARDALRKALAGQGVGTLVHYPMPIHRQPAYLGRIPLGGELLRTEQVCREISSLPMFPELRDDQVDTVSAAIRRALLFDSP